MLKTSLAALAVAASMMAAPASAGVLIIEARGLFTDGRDPQNRLGLAPSDDLITAPFSLNIVYNIGQSLLASDFQEASAQGGIDHGRPTVARFDFDIGGYSFTLVGDRNSSALQTYDLVSQTISQVGFSGAFIVVDQGIIDDIELNDVLDLRRPAKGNIGNLCGGQILCGGSVTQQGDLTGGLTADYYTIRYDPLGGAAIPEPSTWAMLIAGFAGVGGLLRARRRVAITA